MVYDLQLNKKQENSCFCTHSLNSQLLNTLAADFLLHRRYGAKFFLTLFYQVLLYTPLEIISTYCM